MNKTMQNKVTELPMADSLITEATEKTARTPVRVSGFDLEEIGQQAGKEILLQGSVYKLRRMSGFAFVLLRTGRHVIQCVYSSEFSRFGMEELVEESCVRVRALVASEERSRLGWELRLLELQVLSVPAQPMPIVINQKKVDTSLENLLDYRMLTLRNEKQRAIFKIQEGLCQGFRSFLQEQHFTEIHSPKIVEAGAEGGANIFSLDYFGRQAYLAQSPQFYKQMMVGVFERVYEVGPVFRAEKHDTSRHLNEYTGVDFEMGYIESFEEIMEMEEGSGIGDDPGGACPSPGDMCPGTGIAAGVVRQKSGHGANAYAGICHRAAAGKRCPKLAVRSTASKSLPAHGPHPPDPFRGGQVSGGGALSPPHGGEGGF